MSMMWLLTVAPPPAMCSHTATRSAPCQPLWVPVVCKAKQAQRVTQARRGLRVTQARQARKALRVMRVTQERQAQQVPQARQVLQVQLAPQGRQV